MKTKLGGLVGRIPIPTPAMGVALLALLIAASGVAVAAIPSGDGTITACRDNRTGTMRVINAEGGQACTSKETQLRWKDGINGTVADSELLDNMDSTDFLGVNQKAADSDKLDGLDSSELQGPRAYAHIRADGTLDTSRSKNISRVFRSGTGFYCINSTFPPSNVVATISGTSGSGMISQTYGGVQCLVLNLGSFNIQVRTSDADGTPADKAFDVAIN